jgi:hypothetical protein
LLLAPGGLTEALHLAHEAWAETAADDPGRPGRAANLAMVLSAFDDRSSIEMLQEVINSLPAGHIRRSVMLVNLGAARYETPDPVEQRRAIDNWREVALEPAAVTTDRLEAALRWGAAAQRFGLADQALAAHRCAGELLPRATWRGIGTASRQHRSRRWQGLAGAAAAAAIDAGDLRAAVELLESTRGVAWSQLLELRSDLAMLVEKHSELAAALCRVRDALDTPSAEEAEYPPWTATGWGERPPGLTRVCIARTPTVII